MRISVLVYGLSQIISTMDVFALRQIARADAAVQAGADIGLREAQRRCPVGTPASTHKKNYVGGTLKKSLKIKRGVMEAVIYTDVPYGKYVELGTYKMAAQPFLGPANDIAQRATLAMIESSGL